jgi:PAS domain S-box-containing protein
MPTAPLSLRQRLMRQFLLAGLPPLLGLAVLATCLLVPALLRESEAGNLQLATTARDQLQAELNARQRTALLIGEEFGNLAVEDPASNHALRTFVDQDPWVEAAYLSSAAGVVEQVALPIDHTVQAHDIVGNDLSAQAHFRAAREQRAPVWSPVHLSPVSGHVTGVLVVPAGPRYLFVELALDALSKSLTDLARATHQTPLIVDNTGRAVAAADRVPARGQDLLRRHPLVQDALAGRAGSARIEVDGVTQLAQALPVAPLGWAVVVTQPMREALAPLLDLSLLLVATLLLMLAASAWLSWLMARRGGREVERLARAFESASPDHQGPALQFQTLELQALWTRLHELFGELLERDRQTEGARRDLQSVLDAATEVAIIATDARGVVTVFSRGAEKMLQRKALDVVGRTTPLTWHDPDEVSARSRELSQQLARPVDGFEVFVWRARQHGHEVRDWTFVRADGERIDVSLAATAMRGHHGEITGFLGVAVDVSQRRRALELETARRAAEASSEAKTEFLSRMSHELRTPLNAVLGYAQLMALDDDGPPTPRQKGHLAQIERAGWHLLALIDDVLDLSRIESGRMRVDIAPHDPAQVVQRALALAEPQMRALGIDFRLVWHDGRSGAGLRPVLADATRLTQVLVNLLSNAAKYNRRGGHVRLEVEALPGHRLAFSVSDNGIGMSEAQLAQLFQPFNRLGREQGSVEGTGIGLVITRRLLELMNGSLEVRSQPGEGSRFSAVLPQLRPDDDSQPAPLAPAEHPSAGDTDVRGRVLYVEDNAINALLMREVLARQRPGISLTEAVTAEEGLAACRQQRPDLLLLDMHLPDATGATVLARLAADPALAGIPVVMVSADATGPQMSEALALGARAYLTKPLNVAEVLATIDHMLLGTGPGREPGAYTARP